MKFTDKAGPSSAIGGEGSPKTDKPPKELDEPKKDDPFVTPPENTEVPASPSAPEKEKGRCLAKLTSLGASGRDLSFSFNKEGDNRLTPEQKSELKEKDPIVTLKLQEEEEHKKPPSREPSLVKTAC
ncbi:hypothetical protein L2E82_18318 [Cichorium intybus]|uniref:Uncharacterized protein n=1 Tax=Cichorium intybus TaxID=13427 RepID=A0ACB9F9A6_CICIN|nr:hypothetical protein L2E82_18318 [Cichorium intybus]